MVATGQPVDEVEDELREVGRHLGAPDLQVAAGPACMSVWPAVIRPPSSRSPGGCDSTRPSLTVGLDVVGVILAIAMRLLVGLVVSRALVTR